MFGQREHPGDQPQVALMGKLAGDKWKSMTPEERAPYEQMSNASKAEYKKLKSMTLDQRMAAAATAAMQVTPLPWCTGCLESAYGGRGPLRI